MIPFSPPSIDQSIIDEVTAVLRSGWITTGPRTKEFERRLADYSQVSNVLCVNSATAGLELMLRWFGVSAGDEVIVPAYTYCATANVVMHTGATPVLVDVEDDFNIDVARARDLITRRTKAIIPVDIGGWPCRYSDLSAIVNETRKDFVARTPAQKVLGRIMILSDSAHSLGARYGQKMAAQLSDCAVYSFHAVKNLTTAEGGAVCLNFPQPFDNEEIYSRLCISSLHGQSKDALSKTLGATWEYDVVEAGFKSNMSDIAAAMGLVQLARYEATALARRKTIFDKYNESFSHADWAQCPEYDGVRGTSSFHCYMLRVKNIDEQTRNRIVEQIFRQNVAVNVHFKPLPMMSFYRSLGYRISDYPVAYDNYCREISLPVYTDLSDDQITEVVNAVMGAVESTI